MLTTRSRSDLRRYANRLAGDLLSLKSVEDVLLFGSLARGDFDTHSDIDLILIVDEELSHKWFDEVGLRDGDTYQKSGRRLSVASKILQQPWLLTGWTGLADVFLFPPNWGGQLGVLQLAGDHQDPHFMEKIADDATRFHPELGTFPCFMWEED